MKNGKRLTVNEIKQVQKAMPNLKVADYLRVKRNGNTLTLVHRDTNKTLEVPVTR
ncbi:DUF6906 family protein [Paenibacillus chitinolyticus]